MTQKRVVPIDGSTVSHHVIITLAIRLSCSAVASCSHCQASSGGRSKFWRSIVSSFGHDSPSDARHLVGHRNGDEFGWFLGQQAGRRQLAASRLAVSFGPLLHSSAYRGHDRNPVTQYSARRKLQPFMWGRRIAEANNIGKQVAAIGAASAWLGSPDYLGGEITSLYFLRLTFGHAIGLRSSASVSERCPRQALGQRIAVPHRSS
jgi:hypothetical protein